MQEIREAQKLRTFKFKSKTKFHFHDVTVALIGRCMHSILPDCEGDGYDEGLHGGDLLVQHDRDLGGK